MLYILRALDFQEFTGQCLSAVQCHPKIHAKLLKTEH